MNHFSTLIKDFGISPRLLEARYSSDGDSEHPSLPKHEWRSAVSHEGTLLSYWAWVHHQIIQAENELYRDNPYNQTWSN